MGAGAGIGGILQGLAQGFLEAKEEDKGRTRLKKEQDALNKRETAKSVLDNPDLRPEARTSVLAFLAGQGTQAEKAFDLLMSTGQVSATRFSKASALPQGQGQGELPPIALNGEGKIDRNQPQIFSSELPQVPQDAGPPAPTEEALNRQVESEITEELPIFLSAKEKRATGLEVQRELAAESRSEELLLDEQRQKSALANLHQFRQTLELPDDSPLGPALDSAAILAVQGQPDLYNDLVGRHFSKSENLSDILSFVGTLDLADKDLTNAEILKLAEQNLPLVFASMPEAKQAILSQIKSARRFAALAAEDAVLDRELKEARIKTEGLAEQLKLNAQKAAAVMGSLKVKDINTFIKANGDLITSVTKEIAALTVRQAKTDPLTGELVLPEKAIAELEVMKNVQLGRLQDLEFRRDQAVERKEELLADEEPDEISVVSTPDGVPEPSGTTNFAALSSNSPRVIERIALMMSELSEEEAAPFLAEMLTTDIPQFQLSQQAAQQVLKRAAEIRGPGRSGEPLPDFVQSVLPAQTQTSPEAEMQRFLLRHPEVLPLIGAGPEKRNLKDIRIQLPNFK
jgi:hypothetical protein